MGLSAINGNTCTSYCTTGFVRFQIAGNLTQSRGFFLAWGVNQNFFKRFATQYFYLYFSIICVGLCCEFKITNPLAVLSQFYLVSAAVDIKSDKTTFTNQLLLAIDVNSHIGHGSSVFRNIENGFTS